MASKLRVEFVRLRNRTSSGLHDMEAISDQAPVTRTLSGTALTGTGAAATNRVLVPASVLGYTRFHARIISDVECVVSFAPAGDATTNFDASAARIGGITIPANTAMIVPVTPGMLISAATGLSFA